MDYLHFMAAFYARTPAEEKEFVDRAVAITELGDRLATKVGTYSKGMTRKLLLARALMTKPVLAILDEPTSGLDVLNALEVREIIRRYVKEGTSVLLSSHNMLEIEFLSDRVALIHNPLLPSGVQPGGRILDTGTPAELKDKHQAKNLEEVFRSSLR
jgi:ABC-2 type transport system ATP-binding protein